MERYALLEKISSTLHCTYYRAENILTREELTIKKLKATHQWEKLLNCKEVALMKDTGNKYVSRLLEIVKHKDRFYLVHPKLGENLEVMYRGKPFPAAMVAAMAIQMVQAVFELLKRNFIAEDLRTEMYFMERKHIRLSPIPATEGGKDTDYRYFAPERLISKHQTDKSLVFSLGCIMAELLTGKQLIDATSRKDYVNQLNNFHQDQQLQSVFNDPALKDSRKGLKHLLKKVEMPPLVELVEMMLRLNPHERVALEEVHVRLRHLHAKLTEPIGKNRSDVIFSKTKATTNDTDSKSKLGIRSQLDITLPRIAPTVLKTQPCEIETSQLVQTRSYRLHRSVKKVRRNPQRHRYDSPFGFSPCCSFELKHRDMARSKLTHYARSNIRSSNSCISEHLFD